MLPSPYFPDRLLQPIRTHGFATLNTTLYYREHFVDGRVFCLRAVGFAFGRWSFLAFGQFPLVARRAFITGEIFFFVGGSPGLLLQVNFHDG